MSEITAHFHEKRLRALKRVFKPTVLESLWKSVVKAQMRSFEIRDLHDYFDFTRSIASRSKQICDSVFDGSYRAKKPLVYRLEKKLGIKRHMAVPSPYDALALQAIVENLRKGLDDAQPSKSAFYSRDKHQLKLPHEIHTGSDDVWWVLWPKFQAEIFKFSKAKKFLVVTDLTNYYDSLDLRALRTAIVHKMKASEVVVDLMFSVIEDLAWSPDYLPKRNVGLPVVNLESFRFLAHVFLFDADEVLMKQTKKNFTRWMDDINFGVNTTEAARKTLSDLSDTLKSRGLSLNMAKTQVLTSSQAHHHFCFTDNIKLDAIDKKIKSSATTTADKQLAKKILFDSLSSDARNSDKITKRSLRICATLGVHLQPQKLRELFIEKAGLRGSVGSYLANVGYSARRASLAIELCKASILLDDGAKFVVRDLLLQWDVPYTTLGKNFAKSILKNVKDFDGEVGFCVALTIHAKFSEAHDLLTFIENNRLAWETSNFAHRQVISVMPRLFKLRPDKVDRYIENATNSGKPDVVSVAKSFSDLRVLTKLSPEIRATFFPTMLPKSYPISKFLILKWLHDHNVTQGSHTTKQVQAVLKDRWYKAFLLT